MDDQKKIEELTRKLIDFDTANYDDRPGGYTLPLLEFARDHLAAGGIKSKIYRYDAERTVDGKQVSLGQRGILLTKFDRRRPVVLLQGHADTVPVAQKFEGKICRIENGTIHGRGAVDMKSSLSAMIAALIGLQQDKALPVQIALLITSDEEAGSFAGLHRFLEIYRRERPDIRFAICGEATRLRIKHNFLGATYLRFSFAGKSGHAANKQSGQNAIEKAVPFLRDLLRFQDRLEQEQNALGCAVMNIGTIRGGEKVNQIPTDCRIEVSLRTTQPNRNYEKELSGMVKKYGGRMEIVFAFDPVTLPATYSFTAQLRKSAGKKTSPSSMRTEEITPENIMREFTEATLLNRAGIPTVVFGPGNPLLNHTDAERIATRDVVRYQRILEKFARSIPAAN